LCSPVVHREKTGFKAGLDGGEVAFSRREVCVALLLLRVGGDEISCANSLKARFHLTWWEVFMILIMCIWRVGFTQPDATSN
jgi:hypothetical protein